MISSESDHPDLALLLISKATVKELNTTYAIDSGHLGILKSQADYPTYKAAKFLSDTLPLLDYTTFLAPLICSVPAKAKEILDMFTEWGVNRFSINWETLDMRQFFDEMDCWGFEVNIYNVPDLESFLQAVLLMPHSVTSDFNFPKWHYYGRGSGEKGGHYEYSMRKVGGAVR